ncbi:MAG: phosphatase PAP2 family protein [Lachnospiraceae bacterium]|nr:phosphatase PAP2 family protein [Lachnospiraceae bacterium]
MFTRFWKQCSSWVLKFFKKNKHLLILLYFFIYLAWFRYIETTITTRFHVIHVPLDDYIPFCEYFVIPYLLWFAYVAWGITYMALHNIPDYYRLCFFLFTGMTIFLVISTLYPNGQYLRPVYFSHHNICTRLVELLYSSDTPTNLFPSIHVYNSLGVHFAVMNNRELQKNKTIQMLSFLLMTCIILATMFIKQHSIFDVCTGLLLGFIMYRIIYKKDHALRSTI